MLEGLSHNLTLSVLSNPELGITGSKVVSCYASTTQTVWKVNWVPIIAGYATGLGVTLICLAVGGYALVVNGVAHDTSFSSVLRTTRNEELTRLTDTQVTGALPLAEHTKEQRLRFVTDSPVRHGEENAASRNGGFVL